VKIAIDYDDFSPRNSNLGILEDIREHFPNFKVTLFTTPWEIRWGEATPITEERFAPFVEAVKQSSDWMEIAMHGLTHAPMEFAELTYEGARKRVIVAEKMFENRGIKICKLFKAPQWEISKEADEALTDLGYTVLYDGYYNWNLSDDMPKGEKLIAHGHVQNTCGNGMSETLDKIMDLPTDTEFYFLSKALKWNKNKI
jgi:hypothetical protein